MKQTWHAVRYKMWQTGDNRWSVYEDQETFDYVLRERVGGDWREVGRYPTASDAFRGVPNENVRAT